MVSTSGSNLVVIDIPIAQTLSGGSLDYDNNTVALALQTLGSFDFGGKIMLAYIFVVVKSMYFIHRQTSNTVCFKLC